MQVLEISVSDFVRQILEEAGFDATVVPVLSFRFVNRKELGAALQHYERLSGVVFTSPRAVQAISKAISCMPGLSVSNNPFCIW